MLAKWWAFTRWWYLAPNSIIIWHSSGAAAVTRWPPRVSQYTWTPCLFASVSVMFFPPLRTPLIARPASPHPEHHQPLPLSTICCHCDQSPFHRTSHLTGMACSKAIPYLVQMNSWNQFMEPPLPPLPPGLSLSLLHLCTSSSSVSPLVVCLFSNWSHISSPVCRNESMPCSPLPSTPALSPPSTFLCQAQLPPPPLHPPSPNATCSHRCVAPIYGFITAAIHSRRRRGRGERR